jgi:hypothetical protein
MSQLFLDYPFAALFALLACAEAGVRVGRRTNPDAPHAIPADVAGALLGMLDLLLGFTVSMAETRFAARKHLVIDEPNAIGTKVLRSELLPAPIGEQNEALFVK